MADAANRGRPHKRCLPLRGGPASGRPATRAEGAPGRHTLPGPPRLGLRRSSIPRRPGDCVEACQPCGRPHPRCLPLGGGPASGRSATRAEGAAWQTGPEGPPRLGLRRSSIPRKPGDCVETCQPYGRPHTRSPARRGTGERPASDRTEGARVVQPRRSMPLSRVRWCRDLVRKRQWPKWMLRASSMSSISAGGTVPTLSVTRSIETERTCSAWAFESRSRPVSVAGRST